jgi:hypothetical protein
VTVLPNLLGGLAVFRLERSGPPDRA